MSTFHYPARTSLAKILRDLLARVRRLEGIPARAVFEIKLFADAVWPDAVSLVQIGDNRFVFQIETDDLDGAYLLDVQTFLTTAGTGATTCQVRNRGPGMAAGTNMLTTPVTIDSGGYRSRAAGTQPVIDPLNDQVAGGDFIAIDVDAAGTDAQGLGIILTFGGF